MHYALPPLPPAAALFVQHLAHTLGALKVHDFERAAASLIRASELLEHFPERAQRERGLSLVTAVATVGLDAQLEAFYDLVRAA